MIILGHLHQGSLILTSPSISNIAEEDLLTINEARMNGNFESGILYNTKYGKRVSVVHKIGRTNFNIACITIPGEKFNILNDIVLQFTVLFFIWFMILVSTSMALAAKITRPMTALLEGIQAVERGDLAHKISVASKSEIGKLADSYNMMIMSLKNTYDELERQRNEMYDKNNELLEANMEFEASYDQLQATIVQLNEAENKYHSLVRNIPDLVCVINTSGDIVFVNRVVTDVLGYEKEELLGESIKKLVGIKNASILLVSTLRRLESVSHLSLELPILKKDSNKMLADISITKFEIRGQLGGIQLIVRDITKRREMEQEIKKKNEELAVLSYLSKSLSASIDLDTVLSTVTQEIVKIMKASLCTVRLIDETGNQLKVRAYYGPFLDNYVSVDEMPLIDIHKDPLGNVIMQDKIIHTQNIQDSLFAYQLNEQQEQDDKIKDLVFIPLKTSNSKLGALAVATSRLMDDSEIQFLSSVANNASVAIDNALMYDGLKKYYIKTIDALIAAVEAKDRYTQGHSKRVARYVVEIARHLGFNKEQIEDLRIAGILHDIGKIGISDNILSKPGALTDQEYAVIKQHPTISKKILISIGLSDRILDIITFHHERYDGKGYPMGLTGEELSMEAQIIAVADAFDAMTSKRPYRRAMEVDSAIQELMKNKGTQFNPIVVEAMSDIYNNRLSILEDVISEQEEEIA